MGEAEAVLRKRSANVVRDMPTFLASDSTVPWVRWLVVHLRRWHYQFCLSASAKS